MSEATPTPEPYLVSIYEAEGDGKLIFTFVPNDLEQGVPNGVPARMSQFIVAAKQEGDAITFDWSGTPEQPKSAVDKAEMQKEVESRIRARAAWITSVKTLVDQVETWARDLHWSTRRVEKKLDDTWIGKHRVPGLLMQEDTCRILLEPVGRSAPGTEGVIDLYLVPAYDDVATLYHYDGRWNLHYPFAGTGTAATVREATAVPLSKESFEKVLSEMRQNAA